jgi:hypothetical protein
VGNRNTFVGNYAGFSNTTGLFNTFLGDQAGFSNTTGHYNTFLGDEAGRSNTTGGYNAFLGRYAGRFNTTGAANAFLGSYAGRSNTTGSYNTFLGQAAGYENTTGSFNIFLGREAGFANTTGWENTFVGTDAGFFNSIGNNNTFLGAKAGYYNTTGAGNVFIGHAAGYYEAGSNKLCIANGPDDANLLICGDFSTGNVGIGTTNPTTDKLKVVGNIDAAGFTEGGSNTLSNDISGNAVTATDADKVDGYDYSSTWPTTLANIRSACSNDFHSIGGTDDDVPDSDAEVPDNISINNGRLYAPSGSGNIGIGTTSPGSTIHVVGTGTFESASGGFVWTTTSIPFHISGAHGGLGFVDRDLTSKPASPVAGDRYIWYNDGKIFRLYTDVVGDLLGIDNNGNVGIGTTNPMGKLDVNGSIYQRGSQLYADYVFEPGYELESIEEHSVFMWKHKHLKAIPKAKRDENGLEIIEAGAHRKGIVEELEKAHIYIEQLHKHIKELESKNGALEVRLTAMEDIVAKLAGQQ